VWKWYGVIEDAMNPVWKWYGVIEDAIDISSEKSSA